MHESLLGHSPSYDNCYSGYLKMDEGKNNWIEYWVVIREQQILFYSDECSEESGEVAIKTIELSSETRCELLQRRNYHFRFKLLAGANKSFRLKCSSAFHRQQWISHIMLASAKYKDKVIELNSSLNSERNGVHRRTVSTESQISSDAESLYESESGLDSSGATSDGAFASLTSETSETPEPTAENPTAATTTTTERRGSRGLLRRLSFKASNRLRRNSKSSPSPKDELGFSDMRTPSPKSPSSRKTGTPPLGSLDSPKGTVNRNKVFINPAFVPSPGTSPSVSRKEIKVEQCDLIDISQPV